MILDAALEANDIKTYTVRRSRAEDRGKEGVRLATMHRAKGLEFERVIIGGVSEGIVPLEQALAAAADQADRDRVCKRERSLLYVAITRAKREVIMTCHGKPSSWLPVAGRS